MSGDIAVHILILSLEIVLVIVLVLFLFRMRDRFGLVPLYIVLGVLQPLQTILAATYFVEIIPGMPVSPGSAILFTSSLFIILLIYIYQDAVKARNTAYGVLLANSMMMVLFFTYGRQLMFENTLNLYNISPEVFSQTSWATLFGSVILFADVVGLLFLYEAAWKLFPKFRYLRIFSAVSIIAILDSLVFITAVFWRQDNYWMLLLATIIGKIFTAGFFTLALTIYLKFGEKSNREGQSFQDVFNLLSYRQRFELERKAGQERESLLRESEGRFEILAQTSPVGIFRAGLDGKNTYVNPQLCEIAGLSYEEAMGDGWLNGIHPEDREDLIKEWNRYVVDQNGSTAEYRYLRSDGSQIWVIGQSVPERDREGKIIGYVGTITDITELKQAEAAVSESEKRFETMARISPVGIFRTDPKGSTNYVNPRWCEISGMSFERAVGDGWSEAIHPDDRGRIAEGWAGAAIEGREVSGEFRFLRPDGSVAWVIARSVPEIDQGGKIVSFSGTITDITEIKVAEAAISQSEGRFETLAQISTVGIFRTDPAGKTTYVNPRWCEISGMSPEVAMADGWLEGVHPDDREKLALEWEASTKTNRESYAEYRFIRPDGKTAWVIGRSAPEKDESGKITGYTGTITDVTGLKEAEEAVSESEERFRYLFLRSPDAIYLLDPDDPDVDWPIVDCNLAACQMSGYTREELIGQSIYMLDVNRRSGEALNQYLDNVRTHGVFAFETVQRHKDGHHYLVEINTSIIKYGRRELVLGIDRDISKRKDEEAARAKRAVELETLYETSLEVNALSNLESLLAAIVERAASLVEVEAGSLFMLDPDGEKLRMTVEFNSPDTTLGLEVPVGEGLSGRVAQSGEVLVIDDYVAWSGRVESLDEAQFRRVMGVPLKVSGRVIGVINMVDRTHTGDFTEEEIRLVSLFADQAALAIENARLYQGLQDTNLELSIAYEATIEGWSRALDLRDKETEGHTLRVTDLTMKMAEKMGVCADEMIHIRRGALLHDIGKMGVPDRILLKPDLLNDEEWVVMREHPTFAYETLSAVEFLRPALEIPYCHHEKWDGSGYPRKLEREDIPLAARIFAVADVWDALTSDRPYRSAWTQERALNYIREQAGMHFDPSVVEVFLEMRED